MTPTRWPTSQGVATPRDGRAGLKLTGSIDGRHVAVSDGAPELRVGDCDPDVTGDADVCAIADDIDGRLVVLVIENPDVQAPGVSLPIADPGCGDACDDVDDVAVVDLQLDTRPRLRADGGRLEITTLIPFSRYVGDVRLTTSSGSVSGSFDLVPRPD